MCATVALSRALYQLLNIGNLITTSGKISWMHFQSELKEDLRGIVGSIVVVYSKYLDGQLKSLL